MDLEDYTIKDSGGAPLESKKMIFLIIINKIVRKTFI